MCKYSLVSTTTCAASLISFAGCQGEKGNHAVELDEIPAEVLEYGEEARTY